VLLVEMKQDMPRYGGEPVSFCGERSDFLRIAKTPRRKTPKQTSRVSFQIGRQSAKESLVADPGEADADRRLDKRAARLKRLARHARKHLSEIRAILLAPIKANNSGYAWHRSGGSAQSRSACIDSFS